jgi:hypothetical protein
MAIFLKGAAIGCNTRTVSQQRFFLEPAVPFPDFIQGPGDTQLPPETMQFTLL